MDFIKTAGKTALKNGKDNLQGMLGNVSKAVLMFPDLGAKEVNEKEYECIGGAVGGMLGKTYGIAKNADKGLGNLKNTMAKKVTVEKGKAAGFSEHAVDLINKMDYKTFTVQFNPSDIRITSRGGGMRPVTNYDASGKTSSGSDLMQGIDPYAEISFTIVFDDTNNADAFMFEKFTLSPTATLKNASALISSAVGKEYTVKPIVEGFMGALRNKYHRIVLFQWGDLRYWGVMNNIQGKYTMFNTDGNPIRAEINITISSGSSEKKGNYYTPFWQNQYKEIMKQLTKPVKGDDGSEGMVASAGGIAHSNMFNNLLNI